MKKYFYILTDRRVGPLSLEEIKNANISADTLIWYEGLENWQPAGNLEEFKYFSNPIEEAEILKEDVNAPVKEIAVSIQAESSSITPVVKGNRVDFAESNIPIAHGNSFEVKHNADSVSVNHYHGIDDTWRDGNHELIYPKRAMFAAPFSFKGRIRRTEYWLSWIAAYTYLALVAAFSIKDHEASEGGGIAFLLFLIPFYWFVFAQNAKRCHDRGNSGWFQIIPLYGLWMAFGSSDQFVNAYGPNPKGINLQPRF